MSREKRTRPSVGALGRAVETGSAMQADTTSKPQFTPNGPGGQRKVADLLSHGRENAIPRRELERLTGLDGRTVRLMIERERREGSSPLIMRQEWRFCAKRRRWKDII